MSSGIERLANRVAQDPFFLATPLQIYATGEGMDDAGLCTLLGCGQETLSMLRLCRRPRPEPPLFAQDVARIAERFALSADLLAEIVRRADAIGALRQAGITARGALIAARDRQDEETPHMSEEPER